MTVKPKQLDAVPLGRIFLQLANHRHDPFENEAQVIEYLCDCVGGLIKATIALRAAEAIAAS